MNLKIGDYITLHNDLHLIFKFDKNVTYQINDVSFNKANETIFILNTNIKYEDKYHFTPLDNKIHYSYCKLNNKYIRKLKLQKLNENR